MQARANRRTPAPGSPTTPLKSKAGLSGPLARCAHIRKTAQAQVRSRLSLTYNLASSVMPSIISFKVFWAVSLFRRSSAISRWRA